MARNLKGISKSIANKKYSLKSKGITDKRLNEIIPKGYSKLSEAEQQNILNSLKSLSVPKTSNKKKVVKSTNLTPSKLIRDLKKVRKKYMNSIPQEYRDSIVFMNYFTEGHGLKKSQHDIKGYGIQINNSSTVKELEKYYQTKDKKLIVELLKEDIKNIKSLDFNKRMNTLKDNVSNEVEKLFEYYGDGLNYHKVETYKKWVDKLPYHQLKTLNSLLDGMGNVFDSIYDNNSLGGGQGDFFLTLEKTIQIAQKDNISDYEN